MGIFLCFAGRPGETRGRTWGKIRDGFGFGVMISPWMCLYFSGRDLMCAACYNESECTLCTAAEGVDPERRIYWKFGVETADGDAVFHT